MKTKFAEQRVSPAAETVASNDGGAPAAPSGLSQWRKRLPQEWPLALYLVGFIVLFAILSDVFVSERNMDNLTRQGAAFAIIAMGQLFVIVNGGLDISVGAQASLYSIVAVKLSLEYPLIVALLVTLALGVVIGVINGLLVVKARISPMIATLATWQVILGVNLLWTSGQPTTTFATDYRWLGSAKFGFLTAALLVAVIFYLIARVLLYRTKFGRYTYAVGGNDEAARLSGINVGRVTLGGYIACAVFTAAGALVLSSRVGTGFADLGVGLEIQVIAAVFIGGAAWGGGAGRLGGVLLGVALMVVLRNGLDLVGISSNIQTIVTGVLIAAAVAFNRIRRSGEGRG